MAVKKKSRNPNGRPIKDITPKRSPAPSGSFEFWISETGGNRKINALAKEYGVCHNTASGWIKDGRWNIRAEKIDAIVNKKTDSELVETLAQMNMRHVEDCRALWEKAAQFLADKPIKSTQDALKALELSSKIERLARGESTENVSFGEIVRKEHDRWLERD